MSGIVDFYASLNSFGGGYNQPQAQPGVGDLRLGAVNPGLMSDFSSALPGQVAAPGLWDQFKSSGVLNSSTMDPKTGAVMQQQGWGMPALQAASGLLSAWTGMKQYGLAKDAFSESKRQFALNFDAQKRTTNSALEDRQRARLASNAGAYQSLGDYMSQNGIRG